MVKRVVVLVRLFEGSRVNSTRIWLLWKILQRKTKNTILGGEMGKYLCFWMCTRVICRLDDELQSEMLN